jgi:hypothetical protein
MEIERTTFGSITIDGKTYEHDVIIRLSDEVARRKKELSKKYYGTSHVLSKDEAKFVFEDGCEQLILGSGQMGNVEPAFKHSLCRSSYSSELVRAAGSHRPLQRLSATHREPSHAAALLSPLRCGRQKAGAWCVCI